MFSSVDDGGRLTFDEATHTYRYDGVELVSVTTNLKRFSQPFEADKFSKIVADREGRDAQDVLDEWDERLEIASDLGTRTHAAAERAVNRLLSSGQLPDHSDDPYEEGAFSFVRQYADQLKEGCLAEARVCDPELGIAGTVDLLTVFDGDLSIMDFKTNADLRLVSPAKMIPPLHHLDDCSLSHYCLQLNLYRRLLARYNQDVASLYLVWVDGRGGFELLRLWLMDAEIDAVVSAAI